MELAARRRVDAEDGDRRAAAPGGAAASGAGIGPPLEDRGDDRDARGRPAIAAIGRPTGRARRTPSTRRSARPTRSRTVRSTAPSIAGVRGQAGEQDRDAEGDPDDRQERPERPGREAAPGERATARPSPQSPSWARRAMSGRGGVVVAPTELDLVADPAVPDDEDPVGVGRGLRVVGDQHDRLAALDARAPERVEDLGAGRVVEVAGRLVGEEERRPGHERPGDRDALLLAGRQLVGLVALLAGQVDELDRRRGSRSAAARPRGSPPAIVNGSATFSATSRSGIRLKTGRRSRSSVAAQPGRGVVGQRADRSRPRGRPRRTSAGRGRRAAGGACSCRSPTDPSARRTRRPRRSARRRAAPRRSSRRAGRSW